MRAVFGFAALAIALVAPAQAQVINPATVDTSNLATKGDVATMAATIPTPASTVPPGVSDSGSAGNMTSIYALANHTHASKARKGRVLVPAAGFLDVTFSTPFTTGVTPLCAVTAEATLGDTNVVNAQIDGTPTASAARFRITRTSQSVVALIGLTVLSVPTQVATYVHFICLEP